MAIWTIWILKFQMAVVYVFGGPAKLNSDWLQGLPMGLWLPRADDFPIIGRWFDELWMAYLFSYGGLLFDLSIVRSCSGHGPDGGRSGAR